MRRSDQNESTVKNPELYRELSKYQQAGISLWLDGKRSDSLRIANCVREETDYMRDYHMNQENEICGISFDKVRKEQRRQIEFPYAVNP